MFRQLIHRFKTVLRPNSIPVSVFIEKLPPNCTATVHSTPEFTCGMWFIFYSVDSKNDHRTEYFYVLVDDSGSGEYELNIVYDSTRPICSFDSTKEITFVDEDNNVSVEQQPPFCEYEYCKKDDRIGREYIMFLVIYNNNIVLFWNDDDAKVIVKTFDLSSFVSSREYGNFTRVGSDIELTDDSCKITFYTESPGNRYFSAYLDIKPFSSNDVPVVLKDYEFNQMCDLPISGSQFKPDTCHTRWRCTLELTHYVDGKLQENDVRVESDNGSEEESDPDSEDDD
jgi:hypothetical protein